MRLVILSLALAAVLPVLPAAAQGLEVFAGARLSFDNADKTAVGTDLNAYIEGELRHVYGGVSGDVYNVPDSNVLDIYLGYRNETAGGISYDLSYDHSIYPNDPPSDGGTAALSIGVPVGDKLTTTFDASYTPQTGLSDGHLTVDYALNDKVTLTASVGLVQQDAGSGGAAQDFELAAAYQLGDQTAVKLHYYDGSDYDGYFALDLTWDTTLFSGGSGDAGAAAE